MLKTLKINRIVVKIGTKVLVGKDYNLDKERIKSLADQVCGIVRQDVEVVMVSSGAICSGMGLLGLGSRPSALSDLQACAAVGQAHLMQIYDNFFKAHKILTAQVLLTQEDLNDRKRYLNAKATFMTLLKKGVVPIVNENDTISTDEIKFGDNDRLSSLVANLIGADLLILLSSVDGLYRCGQAKEVRGELVGAVDKITEEIEALARKGKDGFGTGGMTSKLQAAKIAANSGIPCIIANGKKDGVLTDIIARRPAGTFFLPSATRMAERKRWLGFSARVKGSITVDEGAKEALIKRDKSLLSSGVLSARGEFKKDDIISVTGPDGREFARGIINYSREDMDKIKGLKTAQIAKVLGYKNGDEIVHKDNLAIM
jgi:glutamate 5-kinase